MAGVSRPFAATAPAVACVFAMTMAMTGCASKPREGNPSFAVSVEQAQKDLQRIANDPHPTNRPILILGGFADPGVGAWAIGARLRQYLPADAKVVCVSFTFCRTFDACRQHVIDVIDRELGAGDDPSRTVEVDVIGLSMGGLVGRYCAAPAESETISGTMPATMPMPRPVRRRLRIHTLFTAASPLSGALRAERWPLLLTMQKDMLSGSDFYRRLDGAERAAGGAGGAGYELVPYVHLGDTVVGAQYAAPTGRVPWWVPDRPGEFAHVGTMTDPRVLADVLRRLRGEKPWTTEPPAPLPAAAQ
jgi:hypothetical protein